jgi:hypothetical protein
MRRYVTIAKHHTWTILAGVIVVTLLAGWVASGLKIDSDLRALLPNSAPSVKGLERLEETWEGNVGRLTVVLSRAEEDASERSLTETADALVSPLEQLPDVQRVEATRPVDFFEQWRLLYLESEDLDDLADQLDERVRWEKKRANPLFVSLGDEDPPKVETEEIEEKYEERLGATGRYYESEDGNQLAVFVYPDFSADDLGKSRRLVERVESVVAEQLKTMSGVEWDMTGRYKKRLVIQDIILEDLQLAMGLALALLSVFLTLYLRNVRGFVMVLVPLLVGTVWAFAWAHMVVGRLNLMTAFLGAVLMGLGVDYGIHLYTRHRELRARMDPWEATAEMTSTVWRANAMAAATTAAALGSLAVSAFQGFFEFGLIAIGGLLLILAAYVVLFPPLAGLLDEGPDSTPTLASTLAQRFGRFWRGSDADSQTSFEWGWGITLIGVVLVTGWGATQLEFSRNFDLLEATDAPAWRLDKTVNDILGRSQTPAVVLTDSAEQSRAVKAELERRRDREGGDAVGSVLMIDDLVPKDVEAKRAELLRMSNRIDTVPKGSMTDELSDFEAEIERVLNQKPPGISDLPEGLQAPFQRREGSSRQVVLVFPTVDLGIYEEIARFLDVIMELETVEPEVGYDTVSQAALLYDISRYVDRDLRWMIGLTLAALLLISFAGLRRGVDVAGQVVMVVGTMAAALGTVYLAGGSLNFLNVIIVPILFGLAIDATFHVLFLAREPDVPIETHATTALAVAAATMTSLLGIGATAVARHQGLSTLGQVAIWGLGGFLIASLLFYGVVVLLWDRESLE